MTDILIYLIRTIILLQNFKTTIVLDSLCPMIVCCCRNNGI